MPNKKINEVELSEVENKQEQLWFSYLKQIAKTANFGKIELTLTISSGRIVNVKNTKIIDNFNIADTP